MDAVQPGECLREAACYGDIEKLRDLINAGTSVNSQNGINGWTALHWACNKGKFEAVQLLLSHGADETIKNVDNKTAKDVTTNKEILHTIFSLDANDVPFSEADPLESSPFNSNYLTNPAGDYRLNQNAIKIPQTENSKQYACTTPIGKLKNCSSSSPDMANDILLRLRIADTGDPDFIEMELPIDQLTYGSFLTACSKELSMNPQLVERIRKLPNIRLRNDMDIKRLKNYDYLEFVVKGKSKRSDSTSSNSYKSISNFKSQTILY